MTPSLAIENAIQDAVDQQRHVFVAGAAGKIKQRLQRFGILQLLPPHDLLMKRADALRQAASLVRNHEIESPSAYPRGYQLKIDDLLFEVKKGGARIRVGITAPILPLTAIHTRDRR